MIKVLLKRIAKRKHVILLISFIFSLQSFTVAAQEKFKVVIDAGHGGADPGNLGHKNSKYQEKDIVLKIALAVGELLDADKKRDDKLLIAESILNSEFFKYKNYIMDFSNCSSLTSSLAQ